MNGFVTEENKQAFENELRISFIENELRFGDYYWYLEPVEVDTYIKEESRFDVAIDIMKIKLPEVLPLHKEQEQIAGLSAKIFEVAKKRDWPILLNEVLVKVPGIKEPVEKVYKQYFSLINHFHRQIIRYQEGDAEALLVATYIVETLLKFEPSLVTLSYIGDFLTFNLNWLIAKLNSNKVLINLEVDTVEYLINRCDKYSPDFAKDETYQALSALFLHKARYEY